MTSGQEIRDVGFDGKIDVMVDEKPVVLEGTKQTGASVKNASIEQDVNIKEDFVLSIELGGGKTKLVGDDEEIEVHDGERFLATENDIKIDVMVDEKPVVLEGTKQTGASVKNASIEQDVNIKEDFVLSIELGGGKTKLVGDDEEIEVHDGERFLATENDVKIDVMVNEKPVVLEGTKQTGASVKKASIVQDVNIKEDFVLSIELGGGKTKLVGNDEEIEVHDGERFLAIENDDNS